MSADPNPEPSLALESCPWVFFRLFNRDDWEDLTPCEQIAKLDAGLRTGARYPAYRPHRLHLEECSACRG